MEDIKYFLSMMGLLLIMLFFICGLAMLRAHYIVKALSMNIVTEDVVVF